MAGSSVLSSVLYGDDICTYSYSKNRGNQFRGHHIVSIFFQSRLFRPQVWGSGEKFGQKSVDPWYVKIWNIRSSALLRSNTYWTWFLPPPSFSHYNLNMPHCMAPIGSEKRAKKEHRKRAKKKWELWFNCVESNSQQLRASKLYRCFEFFFSRNTIIGCCSGRRVGWVSLDFEEKKEEVIIKRNHERRIRRTLWRSHQVAFMRQETGARRFISPWQRKVGTDGAQLKNF